MTIIGTILSVMFLDPPWRWLVIAGLLAFDALEIWIWLRWRKRRSITGADSIVGTRGRVVTICDPEGQVKVRGQIWKARASGVAPAGAEVVVVGRDGLLLEIADPD